MQRIVESIEIKRPPRAVFAFLRDIESRVRLNPSYAVVGFEPLTHKEMCCGARYRFFLKANGKRTKHECEVIEFVENTKIVSRSLDDTIHLTLTLQGTGSGTLLTHDEQFLLPEENFERSRELSLSQIFWELWQKAQHLTFGVGLYDQETQKKIQEIEAVLRSSLRIWLERIRENLEAEHVQ